MGIEVSHGLVAPLAFLKSSNEGEYPVGQLEAGGMYMFAILNSEPPSLTSPELLERGARDQFSLLQTGDLHMVFVQEVLQFCVAVTNAVAVELQDVALPEVNTCGICACIVLDLWTLGST